MLGTCGEQWKPVNTVTNKPLKFGRISIYRYISNNSALNNEVIIRRAGGGEEMGFHCK